MLARLRHDAVVGGDKQNRMIHAHRACCHGVHKFFMAGNVDEPDDFARGRMRVGESEVYGDAARLLLGQPIRIDTGECLDERGLAVVDVPGGADDHLDFPIWDAASHTDRTRTSSWSGRRQRRSSSSVLS